MACTVLSDATLIAVVADGAGSAAAGELGAEIAVDAVIAHLRNSFAECRSDLHTVLREAAARAREAVVSEALERGLELRSFASTLLAAIVTPEGGGALQIGDGVIVVSDGGEGWSWVFWPQRGEYANTTYFLTDKDALGRIQVESFPGSITDVSLMSDGLEPLALHYASRTVHEPFFHGMFRPLLQSDGAADVSALLEQFLSSERVGSRTDDDVSLILATRRG